MALGNYLAQSVFIKEAYCATFTLGEISCVVPRRRHMGFCLDQMCLRNNRIYRNVCNLFMVGGRRYRDVFSTENKRMVDCPHCRCALFWTSWYKKH